MPTDGTLVLLAQYPHTRGAFIANGMIAVSDWIDFNVLKAHHARVIIVAHLIIGNLRGI